MLRVSTGVDQFSSDEALRRGWVRLTMTVCPDVQSARCLTNMCWQHSGVPSVSKQTPTDPTAEGTVNGKSRASRRNSCTSSRMYCVFLQPHIDDVTCPPPSALLVSVCSADTLPRADIHLNIFQAISDLHLNTTSAIADLHPNITPAACRVSSASSL